MARRVCRESGCPTLVAPDAYRGCCARHQQAYEVRRGTPRERGYDSDYRRLKADYERQVQAGIVLTCVICSDSITTLPVTPQHSATRASIAGPSHPSCNLRDAGLASHGLPWTPEPLEGVGGGA